MTDTMPRVGLDVHANQTHLFSRDLASGEFERKRIEGPPTETLPRHPHRRPRLDPQGTDRPRQDRSPRSPSR